MRKATNRVHNGRKKIECDNWKLLEKTNLL